MIKHRQIHLALSVFLILFLFAFIFCIKFFVYKNSVSFGNTVSYIIFIMLFVRACQKDKSNYVFGGIPQAVLFSLMVFIAFSAIFLIYLNKYMYINYLTFIIDIYLIVIFLFDVIKKKQMDNILYFYLLTLCIALSVIFYMVVINPFTAKEAENNLKLMGYSNVSFKYARSEKIDINFFVGDELIDDISPGYYVFEAEKEGNLYEIYVSSAKDGLLLSSNLKQ